MLSKLTINTNKTTIEFPRFKSFKLEMSYIPREELTELRNKNANITFNRATREREESVDTDKFMDVYIKRAILGWTGLTYEIVKSLVPVSVTEEDLTKEIPYSHEDALWLVRNSSEFDTFISDTMRQVDLFSVTHKAEQLKK